MRIGPPFRTLKIVSQVIKYMNVHDSLYLVGGQDIKIYVQYSIGNIFGKIYNKHSQLTEDKIKAFQMKKYHYECLNIV